MHHTYIYHTCVSFLAVFIHTHTHDMSFDDMRKTGGLRKRWIFAALVLMGILYPGAVHELQRWDECLNGCRVQYEPGRVS